MTAVKTTIPLRDLITGLEAALDELGSLVSAFDPEAYAVNPAPGFSSGVGPHLRHCLDHVDVLVSAHRGANVVDYDARRRGTVDETDLGEALRRLDRLRTDIRSLQHESDGDCTVRIRVSADAEEIAVPSRWSREILYVFQHTIHHGALMSSIARSLGIEVAAEIGRAPSTRIADRDRPCAR